MAYLDNIVEDYAKAKAAHEEAARLDKWLSEDTYIFLQEISSSEFRPYDTDHFAAEGLNAELEGLLEDIAVIVQKLRVMDLGDVRTVVDVRDDGISLLFDYAGQEEEEIVVPFELLQRVDSQMLV